MPAGDQRRHNRESVPRRHARPAPRARRRLTRQGEIELATELERRERELWEALFAHPVFAVEALAHLGELLGQGLPEAAAVGRAASSHLAPCGACNAATAGPSDGSESSVSAEHRVAAARLATRMLTLDLDRRIVRSLLARLRDVDRKSARACRSELHSRRRGAFAAYRSSVEAAAGTAARVREEFVSSNLGLVSFYARRFGHTGATFDDLVQEGYIGLLRAVDRFDHRRGVKFSTYATWWILAAMHQVLARDVSTAASYQEARKQRRRDRQGEASRQSGGKALPWTAGASGNRARRASEPAEESVPGLRLVSLEALHSRDDDSSPWNDVVADPYAACPAESAASSEVAEYLRRAVGSLGPIEADVVARRFGLGGGYTQTFGEIASTYGLSRERIRQIEGEALAKLRKRLRWLRDELPAAGGACAALHAVADARRG